MEGYPSNWKRVILAVSPTGLFHAIGGDRADGQCDTEYLGLTPLQKRIYALEKETGNLQRRNAKLVAALKEVLESGPSWLEPNGETMTIQASLRVVEQARAVLKELGE